MGDSKERVRELAREALVAAGRTALRLGINAGGAGAAGGKDGKEKEGPWAYLSRVTSDLFTSKNAKTREQVRPTHSARDFREKARGSYC